MESVTIRKTVPADIPQLLLIEAAIFSTPWSDRSFRYEVINETSISRVALVTHRIIGYICLRPFIDITNIMNLAVIPEFRRKGVGSLLLHDAIRENMRANPGFGPYFLEVRSSNTAAIRLYEKFGFQITGRRSGYYNRPDEDAVIMELHIRNTGEHVIR